MWGVKAEQTWQALAPKEAEQYRKDHLRLQGGGDARGKSFASVGGGADHAPARCLTTALS